MDETGDVLMAEMPLAQDATDDVNHHLLRAETELPYAERSAIFGYDGSASVMWKKMPKALAVENDEWLDYLDVRGCSEVWYDSEGDVIMWNGS